MSIHIKCGGCGLEYDVPESRGGQTGRCRCGRIIPVPSAFEPVDQPTAIAEAAEATGSTWRSEAPGGSPAGVDRFQAPAESVPHTSKAADDAPASGIPSDAASTKTVTPQAAQRAPAGPAVPQPGRTAMPSIGSSPKGRWLTVMKLLLPLLLLLLATPYYQVWDRQTFYGGPHESGSYYTWRLLGAFWYPHEATTTATIDVDMHTGEQRGDSFAARLAVEIIAAESVCLYALLFGLRPLLSGMNRMRLGQKWEQTEETVGCLECGATLVNGETQCPHCGWSYLSEPDSDLAP